MQMIVLKWYQPPSQLTFHVRMFHGTASRAGREDVLKPEYHLGDAMDHSLVLTKNLHNISHAFMPATNLVVSERLKARLEGTPHIDWLEVTFDHVYDLPYRDDDRETWEWIGSDEQLDELIQEQQPADALIDGRLPRYYELIVPRHDSVRPLYADCTPVHRRIGPAYWSPLDVCVSEQMLSDYPVQWYKGFLIFRPDTFAELDPIINRRYSWVERVELGDQKPSMMAGSDRLDIP